MCCEKCGNKIKKDEKFCSNCGNAIFQERKTVDRALSAKSMKNKEVGKSKSKRTIRKVYLIVAIVISLAVILSLIIFFQRPTKPNDKSLKNKDTSEDKNDESFSFEELSPISYSNSYNMTKGTFIARNDRYIFYINNNGDIVRMDADFGERKRIVKGKNIDIIYMYENSLYYHDADTKLIFSSDFDGDNEKQVINMQTCWFTIVDEQLYFVEGYSVWDYESSQLYTYGDFALYKSSIDGTDYKQIILNDASSISIQEDYIVYFNSENNAICSVDLDGTNYKTILEYNDYYRVFEYKVYKDKLYYTINYGDDSLLGLYCIELKNGNEEKIVATYPGSFTFWNDHIIYEADINSSACAVHMCKLDGTDDSVIIEKSINNPIVMADCMYYLDSGPSSLISVYNFKSEECEDFERQRYNQVEFTDKYILYIDSKDNNIYRCNYDGGNVAKLTNSNCSYIFTYENSLYYLGYANGYDYHDSTTPSGHYPRGFFKLDTNGEECSTVDYHGGEGNRIFHDNYAYFTSNYDSHIYRTRIDSEEPDESDKPFLRRSGNGHYSIIYFIENDWVYFSYWTADSSDSSKLARMKLDGSDMQIVIDSPVYKITVYGGKIYYLKSDDNENWLLRRSNMDGTGEILMVKEMISEYAIADDVLYYIDNDERNIYSINMDGTKRTQLNSTACNNLKIYNDRLYFTDLYNHGYLCSMKLDGSDCKAIIKDNKKYKEKTDYKTKGIDDIKLLKEENKDVSYSESDIMTFEDAEFEAFLCEMFQKEIGTITGADLLSVKYFGYYEGSPNDISILWNRGTYSALYENSVLFSTETYPEDVSEVEVLCGDTSVDGKLYREGCTVVTVRSNEWMAEHVMPYLYYFKNMKHIAFGYCWIGDDMALPIGVTQQSINTHSRYLHEPYDELYE